MITLLAILTAVVVFVLGAFLILLGINMVGVLCKDVRGNGWLITSILYLFTFGVTLTGMLMATVGVDILIHASTVFKTGA